MREIYENSEEVIIWLGEKDAAVPGLLTAQEQLVTQRRIDWCSEKDNDDSLKVKCYTQVFENTKNMNFSLADMFGEETFGEGAVDNMGAFCLIYQLSKGIRSADIRYFCHMTWAKRVAKALWAIMDLPWASPLFIQRSLWRRTWVVQETVVARKATIYYCNFTAPWEMFSSAARNYVKDRISDNLDLFGSQITRDPLANFSRTILEIESTRTDWKMSLQGIEFLQILRKFRSREASDKRDKVFALVGLVTYWEYGAIIHPDYTLTAEQVFWRTTISMISSTMSLSVLAGTLQDRTNTSTLRPSWVIDWSEPPQTGEYDRLSRLSMYDAAAGLSGAVVLHGNLILQVKGHFVDVVTSVGGILPHGQVNRMRTTVTKWLHLLAMKPSNLEPTQSRYTLQAKMENTIFPLGGSNENAFWRTLCADVLLISQPEVTTNTPHSNYRRADDSGHAAYRAWSAVDEDLLHRRTSIVDGQWTYAAAPQVVNESKNAFYYALESATSSRRFFVTSKGYMGTGPSSIRKGDYVCVLLGSSVPFIVRRVPGSRSCVSERLRVLIPDPVGKQVAPTCSQTHSMCCSLVGDAYVHGIMDGRVIQEFSAVAPRSIYLV